MHNVKEMSKFIFTPPTTVQLRYTLVILANHTIYSSPHLFVLKFVFNNLQLASGFMESIKYLSILSELQLCGS